MFLLEVFLHFVKSAQFEVFFFFQKVGDQISEFARMFFLDEKDNMLVVVEEQFVLYSLHFTLYQIVISKLLLSNTLNAECFMLIKIEHRQK